MAKGTKDDWPAATPRILLPALLRKCAEAGAEPPRLDSSSNRFGRLRLRSAQPRQPVGPLVVGTTTHRRWNEAGVRIEIVRRPRVNKHRTLWRADESDQNRIRRSHGVPLLLHERNAMLRPCASWGDRSPHARIKGRSKVRCQGEARRIRPAASRRAYGAGQLEFQENLLHYDEVYPAVRRFS